MNLIVIGEAATKVMDKFPEFASAHGDISWRSLRGMRNRLAHGYFDINLEVVWDTGTNRSSCPSSSNAWTHPCR